MHFGVESYSVVSWVWAKVQAGGAGQGRRRFLINMVDPMGGRTYGPLIY